jgi:hypothetical protein
MIRSIIKRIKEFNARLQQLERDHFIVNRIVGIRMKDPWYMGVDPKNLEPIKIKNGKLNEEGQKVLTNVLAEYLRKKSIEGSQLSFGVYLEKARDIVQKLSLDDFVKLGLLSGITQESCFIPENYYSANPIIPD